MTGDEDLPLGRLAAEPLVGVPLVGVLAVIKHRQESGAGRIAFGQKMKRGVERCLPIVAADEFQHEFGGVASAS